jgi:hypothetical protein
MSEYIKHNGDPAELAGEAYRLGFYVEAIQILHAFLENQARSLFMLVGCVHFESKQKEIWEIADSFSLHNCLKALLIINQITKSEFEELNEFNSMRNKVVHQIFKEPYEKAYLGVLKSDFDNIFNSTLEQIRFFTCKIEEIIE